MDLIKGTYGLNSPFKLTEVGEYGRNTYLGFKILLKITYIFSCKIDQSSSTLSSIKYVKLIIYPLIFFRE